MGGLRNKLNTKKVGYWFTSKETCQKLIFFPFFLFSLQDFSELSLDIQWAHKV
jgi:hypothetical protein